MTKIYYKKIKFTTGFTLLEALVAISIIMVSVVAPITISQKGLSSAVYTKNYMLASYLAQDAMEYIKNKRDYVTINNDQLDWENLSILDYCLVGANEIGSKYCQIDTVTGTDAVGDVKPCVGIICDNLKLKDKTFYGFEGINTDFNRKISIKLNPNGNADEALVQVIVTWGSNVDNKIELYSLIYNY